MMTVRAKPQLRSRSSRQENAAMQNTIVTLQTQLQEAKDEISSSEEMSSPQEGSGDLDTDKNIRQARREASLRSRSS